MPPRVENAASYLSVRTITVRSGVPAVSAAKAESVGAASASGVRASLSGPISASATAGAARSAVAVESAVACARAASSLDGAVVIIQMPRIRDIRRIPISALRSRPCGSTDEGRAGARVLGKKAGDGR